MKELRIVLLLCVLLVLLATVSETRCADADNELMMLKRVIQNLANNMKALKEENNEIKDRMKGMTDEISKLKEENMNFRKEIGQMKNKNGDDIGVNSQVKDEKKEERRIATLASNVAFYARISHDLPVRDNEVIVFDNILTNLGGGYNGGSGVFRVTEPGYYVFFVNLLTEPHKVIEAFIVKNGGPFLSIYAGTKTDAFGAGSNMAVVLLEEGDDVWVKVHDTYHDTGNVLDSVWCTFSGFLLYNA